MRTVCVYCGSSPGADPAYTAAARAVGERLAVSGRRIVYGGGRVGVMGALADAALAAGGEVVGVIPQSLVEREAAHRGLTELRIVRSMHERKAVLADLAEGFLVLPGGLGTLEELFEAWTWGQLGLHAKPYALLNVGGLFDPLLAFLDDLVRQRLLQPEHRAMLRVGTDPAALIADMAVYRPPYVAKWIDREST